MTSVVYLNWEKDNTMKRQELKEIIKSELNNVLTEKSESYREAELKKVAQMTDRNQHLEARHFVAKKGGYTKHVKAYTALIALQDALGHTPRGAEQVRSDLDLSLIHI